MSKYRFSVVACARWETRFIVEWLNYYRAIGFDQVFLYCNDDDPRGLYEAVLPFVTGGEPFVTFRHYPVQGEQLGMYAHFLEHDRERSDWIGFFDIDEYLRLPRGMTIERFVAGLGEVDCVLFNWVFFGPNGHREAPGASILRDYTWRQREVHPFTKYVARSGVLTGPLLRDATRGHGFWHRPLGYVDRPVRAVNAIGEDMSDYYEGFPERPAQFVNEPARRDALLATAIMHHYAFRSEAAFTERTARGLGGAFGGQTTWRDLAAGPNFRAFLDSLHEVEDRALADFWPELLGRAAATTVFRVGRAAALPLSRGKRATQSSVSAWSRGRTPEADAANALDGVIDGSGKFHTDLEDGPWWQVDLGDVYGIGAVRLFNRMDQPRLAVRARCLAIEIGFDPERLVEVFRREAEAPFGGVDGKPLVFAPPIPVPGRFVRVRLLRRDYLHLDQVEVYGERLPGFGDAGAG